jgi:NAD+ kinase
MPSYKSKSGFWVYKTKKSVNRIFLRKTPLSYQPIKGTLFFFVHCAFKTPHTLTVALYSRQINVRHVAFVQRLIQLLEEKGIKQLIHTPYYNQLKEYIDIPAPVQTFSSHTSIKDNVDFMFSLGGDGTLLDAVAFVRNYNIPIMGINMGRLGFLANIGKEDIEAAISSLENGSFVLDKRSMIELESNKPLFGEVNFALNEFALHKKDTSAMITIHTYINGEFLNSYWVDGLIVSTATGSTGYNLSCGGPIIMPQSANFVITPIAPHNLSVRPIVVSDDSVISFEIQGRGDNYLCTLDSRYETIDTSYSIAVKKCGFNVSLVKLPDHNFLSTIAKKLHWGTDARN